MGRADAWSRMWSTSHQVGDSQEGSGGQGGDAWERMWSTALKVGGSQEGSGDGPGWLS